MRLNWRYKNNQFTIAELCRTFGLIFGASLYSISTCLFFYLFETRRYMAVTQDTSMTHESNLVFLYGQVITSAIYPLVFLIIWKLKNCDKPFWIRVTTLLIPLLIILSSVITSGRFHYQINYLSSYLKETCTALLFTLSLWIIKYTQKSMMNTFLTIVFTEMVISGVFWLLKYLKIFIWIYSDNELYPNEYLYEIIIDPLIVIPAVCYTISIFLTSLMMAQSIRAKTGKKWTNSKIRITSLLCLKAFE